MFSLETDCKLKKAGPQNRGAFFLSLSNKTLSIFFSFLEFTSRLPL